MDELLYKMCQDTPPTKRNLTTPKKEILAQLEKDFPTFDLRFTLQAGWLLLSLALPLSVAFVGLGNFASADASDSTLVLGSSLKKAES